MTCAQHDTGMFRTENGRFAIAAINKLVPDIGETHSLAPMKEPQESDWMAVGSTLNVEQDWKIGGDTTRTCLVVRQGT